MSGKGNRLEAGTLFGSYKIEGFIAAGGMGQVYAATHEVYGTPVALKVLHENLHEDPNWRLRFNLEGVIGQQLKHPNVLSARELVEHETAVALVMDLVHGSQTLEQIIGREFPHGMPPVAAIRTLLGILEGVEYAHLRNVVHGDIKPENILIQATEFAKAETWTPKVTDFGTVSLIAHPVMIEGRTAVVATPRYASPEHILGVDRLERRSDIYSLGLLLHYLLTGQHASAARTVKEAAERVRLPVPLVTLVDQPDALISVFRTAAMVDKEDRYPSCRDFALALRGVLDTLGAGLELEDLTADLATEVMEERSRIRHPQAQPAPEGPTALLPDPAASADVLAESPSEVALKLDEVVPEPFMPIPGTNTDLETEVIEEAETEMREDPESPAVSPDQPPASAEALPKDPGATGFEEDPPTDPHADDERRAPVHEDAATATPAGEREAGPAPSLPPAPMTQAPAPTGGVPIAAVVGGLVLASVVIGLIVAFFVMS